ncbi:uncharacterized protein MYCFIDRAFT_194158 [Pseudocercospora fijiensis CIRAD86]|uniref:Uncharacterized protein n=1 Tax=Pseudocercospora fijiensis (strain CIRAD86) TaxID=383855 RepID=M2Z867_PSEFD|nr:uncharacterized protein MYCFIDRAFT_194158 [Pseudocercospora fijiensis CIRAD86]EME85975.1 hypothetical protein MYCFIDRAFT_194158 [Pseudocercospora fijiensis CIRAD86]
MMADSPDTQHESEATHDECFKSQTSQDGRSSGARSPQDSSAGRVQFRMPDYSPHQSDAIAHATSWNTIPDSSWLHYGTMESGPSDASGTEAASRNAHRFSIHRLASLPRFSITQFPRFSVFHQRDYRRLDILLAVVGFVLVGSLFSALLVRIASTNRGRCGGAEIA